MVTDVAASVRARLKNVARSRQRPFNEVLQYFGMERLLYRLSQSPYRDRFVLKGALMMVVWDAPGARPTKDIDLLGHMSSALDEVRAVFVDVCTTSVEEDGAVFDPSSVTAVRIKEDADYEGVRVVVRGNLGTARLTVQVDVGFGDVVHPAPEKLIYPPTLDLPAPELRGYPRETVVAEKLNAMVSLQLLTSRMKDFYDLWLLSEQFEFNYERLRGAIERTFAQRGTKLPLEMPVVLTEALLRDPQKPIQWEAFRRRLGELNAPSLEVVVARLALFLGPVSLGQTHVAWPPGGPWR